MHDMSVFGPVWEAAGVNGFFGEGYPHYKLPGRHPDLSGATKVSKTATLHARDGNVKKGRGIFEKVFPSWAKVKIFFGHTLNAMGLPNDGIEALLKRRIWQQYRKPFFISIASVQDTMEKRIEELRRIIDIIGEYLSEFWTFFGLQINLSCPNTGHALSNVIKESICTLNVASPLGVPLVLKYAIDTAPVLAIAEVGNHPNCDGICVSNTIKFGWKGIDWKKVWGSDISPLAHLDGGGLSGPVLLPFVCRWIEELRYLGFDKHINGGGGIFCPDDVDKYHKAGADSVFVGTVATHHPSRVKHIIRRANTLTWR